MKNWGDSDDSSDAPDIPIADTFGKSKKKARMVKRRKSNMVKNHVRSVGVA